MEIAPTDIYILFHYSIMNLTPDPNAIASIQAANVVVGGTQTIFIDGNPIVLPTLTDLLAYLGNVQRQFQRWADQPNAADAESESPSASDNHPDHFIEMRALPMRLAAWRAQPSEGEVQSVELLAAVKNAQRTFILGEPGSGKSAALERLAWVTASQSLQRTTSQPDAPLLVPLLARLADYRGEAAPIPLLRPSLNHLEA